MKAFRVLSLAGLAFLLVFFLGFAGTFWKGESFSYADDLLSPGSYGLSEAIFLPDGRGLIIEKAQGRSGKGSSMTEMRKDVVTLVNQLRASERVSALSWDDTLGKAAQVRAEELLVDFSHTRPDGSSYDSILKKMGVKSTRGGENIAMGTYFGPVEVVESWSNSKGHRANMLNKGYTKIGVGVAADGNEYYWVQLFTN
jgi:uncharacterized protein YkwD